MNKQSIRKEFERKTKLLTLMWNTFEGGELEHMVHYLKTKSDIDLWTILSHRVKICSEKKKAEIRLIMKKVYGRYSY